MKKTYAEQIRDLEATLLAKRESMAVIMEKASDEGRSTDDEEGDKVDELQGECSRLLKDIDRLKGLESIAVPRGRTVVGPSQGEDPGKSATRQRGGEIGAPSLLIRKQDPDEEFPGQFYTRMVIAKMLAHMEGFGGKSMAQIAHERWGKTHPKLAQMIRVKTGVSSGGTDSGEWGAELATADARYTGTFIDYLYGATCFDMLPLTPIPDNVTIKGQDGASTAYWVGQSKAIPVTTADFMNVTLTSLKVAAIAVISKELARRSTPSAEMKVRDSLVEASRQKVDSTFFSAAAAVAGVSPAGILNGVSGHNSHGSTIEGVIADINQLYSIFESFNNTDNIVLATTRTLGKSLSLMQNALGQFAFPQMMKNGGVLLGDTVYTSSNIASGNLIAMSPKDIYKIDDRGVEVSVTDVATLEQDTAPQGAADTPTAASATTMSMFQTESLAIKVVRPINFAKARASAVQLIDGALYGATDTST